MKTVNIKIDGPIDQDDLTALLNCPDSITLTEGLFQIVVHLSPGDDAKIFVKDKSLTANGEKSLLLDSLKVLHSPKFYGKFPNLFPLTELYSNGKSNTKTVKPTADRSTAVFPDNVEAETVALPETDPASSDDFTLPNSENEEHDKISKNDESTDDLNIPQDDEGEYDYSQYESLASHADKLTKGRDPIRRKRRSTEVELADEKDEIYEFCSKLQRHYDKRFENPFVGEDFVNTFVSFATSEAICSNHGYDKFSTRNMIKNFINQKISQSENRLSLEHKPGKFSFEICEAKYAGAIVGCSSIFTLIVMIKFMLAVYRCFKIKIGKKFYNYRRRSAVNHSWFELGQDSEVLVSSDAGQNTNTNFCQYLDEQICSGEIPVNWRCPLLRTTREGMLTPDCQELLKEIMANHFTPTEAKKVNSIRLSGHLALIIRKNQESASPIKRPRFVEKESKMKNAMALILWIMILTVAIVLQCNSVSDTEYLSEMSGAITQILEDFGGFVGQSP